MKFWLGPVIALAMLALGSAEAARITGVQEKADVKPAPSVNSLEGRRLPKFVDGLDTEVTRFDVEWETAAEDRGPLTLEFHFRTESRRDAPITSMSRPFERMEAGRRLTSFTIPPGKRAAAWRVRLVQDHQVLAERVSTTWN